MRRAAVPLLACALLAAVALLLTVRSTFAPPPGPGARAPAAGAPSAVRVDGADAGTAPAAAAAGDAAAADARTASAAVLDYAAERTGYRGRVVAARSLQPVPGMNVTLCRGAPDLALPPGVSVFARAPIEPQIVAARARTGADGRFQLDGVLPRGLCFLRLEFPDVTQAPPPWRGGQGTTVPVQRTPAPGEVVDLGDLPLKPGATLLGRVVDGQGPVAGATVRAARLPPVPFGAVPVERLRPDGALLVTAAGIRSVIELPRWVADVLAELPIPTSSTAADGTFALYGVDPGVNVVAATAPQHASLLRQGLAVEPDATQALGDLELPAGEEVEIAVADPSGAPIAGAEVLVAPQSTGVPVHIAERAGRTDGDGRVRVRGLPRGSALAAARRSPKEEWVVGEPAPVDGEVRVTLPAAFALTLAVQGPQSKPAADVQLRLVDASANAGAVELSMFGLLRGVDLDDRLRRLDDGRLRIERLRAGTWCVVVGASGCASTSFDVELRADVDRTVQLRAARALRVRTIDADGAPVAAATIYVQPRGGERAQRIVELPLAAGRTDGDGWCTVKDLPTDETRITASHPRLGSVHATIAGAPPETVLQFAAPCSLRGTLTDGGRPPAP
ncbi:MAG TPA: carboxypeptidase-like regulatory domain-containing protein, partial [Burkholderiaceae bacterium]|nr:carboxypeptidase-like regulatory domain-containing protein [Burkholderiaceae bacterium]